MNNKLFQKTINWVFTFVLTLGLFLPASSTLALPQKAAPAAQPALAITPVNPDDTRYADGSQWNLNGAWGINAPMAWGITSGSATTIVAVLDTGYTDHLDLDPARILPGYDFVSDVTNNDTDGRDGEPHDPGDFGTCGDSSWQGTRTAGIIAAASGNALGVAGIDWNARILPVRVLGTCGSTPAAADIVDGMRWAAGLAVGGVTTNPNPAKVIHVSASLPGVACTTAYQADVDAVINDQGAVIIAPAGDQGGLTNNFPSNCAGVITVAATDLFGKRASYSNYSGTLSVVEISAPGGGNGQLNVLSTANSGANSADPPLAGSIYTTMQGTSMAAAHVSGVVS
ncbi:MAG: S8 family serine peptidase, partial [Anaerolineales bacterium]|nr:S8 family serine peptidase [Anaerolineales bacterium]